MAISPRDQRTKGPNGRTNPNEVTYFFGIVAYLLKAETVMAGGGRETGPMAAAAAAEGGGIEDIGTVALTEGMPRLLKRRTTRSSMIDGCIWCFSGRSHLSTISVLQPLTVVECRLVSTGELGALPTLLVMTTFSGRESLFVGESGC